MPRCEGSLRCSFCYRSQEEVGTLLSKAGTPPDRAYICADCVRELYEIMQADQEEFGPPQPEGS